MVDLTPIFPDLRVIELQKISYCGIACLADSIRHLLNKNITQDEIGDLLQIDLARGTPHHKMIEGARFYGLNARVIQDPDLSLVDLAKELEQPNTRIILNIMTARSPEHGGDPAHEREEGHYVVFEGVAKIKDQIYAIYNDPGFPASIQLIKQEMAEKQWFDLVPEYNYQKISHWALILSKP